MLVKAASAATSWTKRIGLLAGIATVATLAVPASAAVASVEKAKVATNFTCLATATLDFATGGTYLAPTKAPGFANGAGTCSYKSSANGSVFQIDHAPLDKTNFKKDVVAEDKKDKLISIKGVGSSAYYGKGKLDAVFVSKGGKVYEDTDGSGKATEQQLVAVIKAVLPA
jgi:hypothetical protein